MRSDALVLEIEEARRNRTSLPPPSGRFDGFSMADAYTVGDQLARRRTAQGHAVAGLKIGLTYEPVWDRIGVEAPIWAPVYSDTTRRGTWSLAPLLSPRLEVELVFRLCAPLAPGAALSEVASAVEAVAPGFEIVDCHYPEWKLTPVDLVADHGLHAGLLLGEFRGVGSAEVLAMGSVAVRLCRNGEEFAEGQGSDVLGGPAQALERLLAAPFAPTLAVGELVSTGALTRGAHPLGADEVWIADVTGFPTLHGSFER